jgi:hypothetical protein
LQTLFTENSCEEQLLAFPPSLEEGLAYSLLLWALFTESSHGEQLLPFLPSLVCTKHPAIFFFFFAGWESVCPGPYAGLPQEWPWEYRMLLICSPVGLHHLKQTLNQCLVARLPSWFLSVMWHGEALCRLEVQSVRVLLILGGFSCQVWIQHLRKIFDLQISSSL